MAFDVVKRLHHAQLAASEVHVLDHEAGELTEPEAARRCRPHQALESRVERTCERTDVVPLEHRALDCSLGRRANDLDRVACDQAPSTAVVVIERNSR